MRLVTDLVTGPFSNEQEFKMAVIKRLSDFGGASFFCIETEETVPGFPDALKLPYEEYRYDSAMIEFKRSDTKGDIKFKKSQPLFYRQNYHKHNIYVLAWDTRFNQTIFMTAEEVVAAKKLTIRLPDTVPLRIAADEL